MTDYTKLVAFTMANEIIKRIILVIMSIDFKRTIFFVNEENNLDKIATP